MKTMTVRLTGVAPLLVHSERLANPRDPATIELKSLSTQRNKTEEVLEQIAEVEWRASIYQHDGYAVLPSDNLLAAVKEAARKRKQGKQVESGVFAQAKYFDLEIDGKRRTVQELWGDARFFDYRAVGVNQRRCMRARPVFPEWSVVATFAYDPDLISEADLFEAVAIAGRVIGLCEKRPQLGRFDVEMVQEVADAAE